MKLKKDIYSTFKRCHLYGAAGTAVTIVAHHGHVKIVEDGTGNRFSVSEDNLIENEGKTEESTKPDFSYLKTESKSKRKSIQKAHVQTLFI